MQTVPSTSKSLWARVPLATKILLGLVLGAAAGATSNAIWGSESKTLIWIADNIAKSAGDIFLRMLFMVVVPLVFSSLVLGIAGLGDLKRLGRIGAKTMAWFVFTTALAAAIGLVLVNTVKPGKVVSKETTEKLAKEFAGEADKKKSQAQEGTGFSVQTFIGIIPKNVMRAATQDSEMLGVIFFAIVAGIAATSLPKEKGAPFLGFLEALYEICVKIIGYAMAIAPFGVFGLIFSVTAKLGFGIIISLGYYVVTVLSGLVFQQFVVLGILVAVFGGMRPFEFFRRTRGLMITAFSTSSSNATLPSSIKTAQEELGVPREIAGFVLPLGATMNMNGTALFEGVTVLFLAQISGVDLSLGQQILVVALSVLTAIGAAGVPGGSLPLISLVLVAVGIRPEMLAVILGVDRIIDMARTVPNVTGDIIASMWVAKSEGILGPPGSGAPPVENRS